MSMRINNVIIAGRLTKDPEVRKTQNGTSVCHFTLAVDRKKPDQNSKQAADFINCVAWKQSADYLQNYGKKGSQVAVIGSIQTSSYKNQQGQMVYVTEVNADNVQLWNNQQKQVDNRQPADPYPSYDGYDDFYGPQY